MINISVIIPTYKPRAYIEECLLSLSKQGYPKDNFEIIIVLNGCNEPYRTNLQTFIDQHMYDMNVCFIQTDVPGVSNARNIALDSSQGEYICFIDDDDFVSENYLKELYKHADKDVIPVCRPLSFIDGESNYSEYNITQDYNKYSDKKVVPFYKAHRFFNGPVYKLIHHDIIGDRRFDKRFKNGEDSLFMFLISDRIKYIEFADPSAIYYRRIRANSATQVKKPLSYSLMNYSHLMLIHTEIFFRHIGHYNFIFFLHSMLSRIKSMILD